MTLLVFSWRGGGLGPSHADPSILLYVLVYVPHNSSQNSFGLNGLAGPCVRFSGDAWRDGVQIATPPGCFPMAAVVGRSLGGRCVISCATPPTPPSMRETASHPMTAAEHLAAGSLRTAAGALIASFLD